MAAAATTLRPTTSTSTTTTTTTTTTSTIATSVLRPPSDVDDTDDDEEGPFFDLEFTSAPDEEKSRCRAESDGEDDEEREFNFAVSSEGSGSADGLFRSETFSPSDDLFFKGKLVPLEPSSIVIATATSDSDTKPQFPVSFLKSATKLRVFMLGLRKPKSSGADNAAAGTAETASTKQTQPQNNMFVKFKVEDAPIVSLFTRDNRSRNSSSGCGGCKPEKTPSPENSAAAVDSGVPAVGAEEKKFVVHKYLDKIKPLYVRVSKRYSEKFSGQLTSGGAAKAKAVSSEDGETDAETEAEAAAPPSSTAPTAAAGGGKGLPAGLKVVCKRLGKSRSAAAAVGAAPAIPTPQRRDDSLLQQEDGIQSAIAHCKRSFTAAEKGKIVAGKGSEPSLVRSMSDPGDGRSER